WGTDMLLSTLAYTGTRELLQQWDPLMFRTPDDPQVAALCVTEPGAGSDVSALRTTARRDGDEWVLRGKTIFATNGGPASVRGAQDVRGDQTFRCGAGRGDRAGRVRVRAGLRKGAPDLRQAAHRAPGHRVQAGRHGDGDRRVAPPHAPGGVAVAERAVRTRR